MNKKLFEDVERFCQEIRPIEDICYLDHRFNDKLIPIAKKNNLLGLPVERRFGGRAVDNFTFMEAMKRISQEGSGMRTFFSVHSSLGQKLLQRFGTEDIKKRYLPDSITGKCILAFALTEPEAGSDPLSMQMSHVKKGKGYVLNGVKYLISNAGIATAIIVFAKGKNGRVSAFIIDTDKEGIEREDLLAKMGMFTTNTGMFELTDYFVPAKNLLGKLDDGWSIAKYGLMCGRLSVAAGCVGVIIDCLKEAIQFSKERVQHKKLIGKHQLIQAHLARIKLHQESSSLMVEKAAKLLDAYDRDPSKDNQTRADNALDEAKFFAGEAAWDAADRAVQIFGGRGWSFLYRPGRHLVDTRVCRIYEGTEEILKLKIAEALLGKDFSAFS